MKSQHGRRRKERHMGKYICICVTLRACSPVLRFSRYVDICPVDIDRKLTLWTTYHIIDDPHVVIDFWALTFPIKWSEMYNTCPATNQIISFQYLIFILCLHICRLVFRKHTSGHQLSRQGGKNGLLYARWHLCLYVLIFFYTWLLNQ